MKPPHRTGARAGMLALVPVLLASLLLAGCGTEPDSNGDGEPDVPSVGDGAVRVERLEELPEPARVPGSSDALGPSIAVDEDGGIVVAWAQPTKADAEGRQHVLVATSTDRGDSWSAPVRVTRVPDAHSFANAQVKVQSLSGGRLLLTYPRVATNDRNGARYSTRASTSSDGGRTWTIPRPVRTGTQFGAGETYQGVAVDGDDAWMSMLTTPAERANPTSPVGMSVARSVDAGATWDVPTLVDVRTGECSDTAIVVDSKRRVFVAYRDQRSVDEDDPIREIVLASSFDEGATFSDASPIVRTGWHSSQCPESGPELAVDGKDHLHVAFWRGEEERQGITYARSDDHGRSFDPIELAVEESLPPSTVDVASTEAGDAWITWDDARTKTTNVWLERVNADGTLFRADGPVASGSEPAIAAHGDVIAAAWVDDDEHVAVLVHE